MEVVRAHVLMYVRWMMFGRIVSQVLETWVIMELKNVLCFLIHEPPVSHFHCAGTLSFDGVIANAYGGGVVDVDWDFWLWMAQFV